MPLKPDTTKTVSAGVKVFTQKHGVVDVKTAGQTVKVPAHVAKMLADHKITN